MNADRTQSSLTTTVKVTSYEPQDYGATAYIMPADTAGIDARVRGEIQVTEDTAGLFTQGKVLKVTFEEVE